MTVQILASNVFFRFESDQSNRMINNDRDSHTDYIWYIRQKVSTSVQTLFSGQNWLRTITSDKYYKPRIIFYNNSSFSFWTLFGTVIRHWTETIEKSEIYHLFWVIFKYTYKLAKYLQFWGKKEKRSSTFSSVQRKRLMNDRGQNDSQRGSRVLRRLIRVERWYSIDREFNDFLLRRYDGSAYDTVDRTT